MRNKFIRILALTLCLTMLLAPSTLMAIAEEAEEERTWEDEWKEDYQPAYTASPFETVQDRIAGDENFIKPMELYAVVDGYAFYGDGLTGEMIFLVLQDKSLTKEQIIESGEIPEYTAFYCTNPYNAGNSASKTDATEKEKLLSQIIIKFSESEKDSQMSSFTDAASNKQITVKNIRGGVRVEYTIGREQVTYLVPRLIKTEKLEALIEQVANDPHPNAARAANTLRSFYIKYDINAPGVPESRKKEWRAKYPVVDQFPVYACDDTTTVQELLRLEKFIKQYTTYDYDTLEADHAETEYVSKDKVPPLFKLALEYKVDGEEIVIRCNAGNIRFDSSLYKLSDVLVLPYGGAGDTFNNTGYLFSPDGSGSIIDFDDLNEQFTNTSSLYGQDYAYHTITGQNREVARLPVFGVCQTVTKGSPVLDPETGEQMYDEEGDPISKALQIAYFAIIEEGDSLAKINVSYGGPVHSFASIYTSFNPRPKDSYVLDGGISAGTDAMWTVESKRKYTGDFQIRLFILDGTEDGDIITAEADADKSYSDMAAAYRDYLVRTGVLKPIEDLEDDIPLYLETLGAIETTKTVLGVPVDTMLALTSFKDTQDILNKLRDNGVSNVKVKMNAWYNGGIMANIATKLKIEKVLGGEDGFEELIAYAKEHNVTLFPDIELTFAYRDKSFDGFDSDEDLAQTIDERPAGLQEYDPVLQAFNKSLGGVISPNFMNELYDSANKTYSKFNVGGISVGSVGKYLSSDFNPDKPLTREDTKELVSQLLEKISENNEKVLVTAGNEYTLPYVTDIIDMPLDDSRLLYSYATVPFMSMVLHGYKEYAGTALNLAGDYNYHLLKTIESGASPYFVVAMNNTSELKNYTVSEIAKYYSVRYSIWQNDIIEAYEKVNNAISDVQSACLIKHDLISADGKVVKVSYDNGITFFINYGEKDYVVEYNDEDIDVLAGDFVKFDANGKIIYAGEGK